MHITPDAHGSVSLPPQGKVTLSEYLRTRVTSLKPPMEKVANPFRVLKQLNKLQWLNFGVAFAAWCWDTFDFFTVSMTLEDLAATFGKTKTDNRGASLSR
jgi:MFS transporter, SHS family, lactate transporter